MINPEIIALSSELAVIITTQLKVKQKITIPITDNLMDLIKSYGEADLILALKQARESKDIIKKIGRGIRAGEREIFLTTIEKLILRIIIDQYITTFNVPGNERLIPPPHFEQVDILARSIHLNKSKKIGKATFEKLLKKFSNSINELDGDGNSLLFIALESGNFQAATALLRYKPNPYKENECGIETLTHIISLIEGNLDELDAIILDEEADDHAERVEDKVNLQNKITAQINIFKEIIRFYKIALEESINNRFRRELGISISSPKKQEEDRKPTVEEYDIDQALLKAGFDEEELSPQKRINKPIKSHNSKFAKKAKEAPIKQAPNDVQTEEYQIPVETITKNEESEFTPVAKLKSPKKPSGHKTNPEAKAKGVVKYDPVKAKVTPSKAKSVDSHKHSPTKKAVEHPAIESVAKASSPLKNDPYSYEYKAPEPKEPPLSNQQKVETYDPLKDARLEVVDPTDSRIHSLSTQYWGLFYQQNPQLIDHPIDPPMPLDREAALQDPEINSYLKGLFLGAGKFI